MCTMLYTTNTTETETTIEFCDSDGETVCRLDHNYMIQTWLATIIRNWHNLLDSLLCLREPLQYNISVLFHNLLSFGYFLLMLIEVENIVSCESFYSVRITNTVHKLTCLGLLTNVWQTQPFNQLKIVQSWKGTTYKISSNLFWQVDSSPGCIFLRSHPCHKTIGFSRS